MQVNRVYVRKRSGVATWRSIEGENWRTGVVESESPSRLTSGYNHLALGIPPRVQWVGVWWSEMVMSLALTKLGRA